MIMIRRMALLIVPNIKGTAYIGTWYCAENLGKNP
jgi:hypothetical protein